MSGRNKMQQKGRSTKKQQITLAFIFIAGLSIFLYPIISNAINSRHQTYAVDSYDKAAAKISREEKEKIKKEAQAFNESLQGGSAEIIDPFSGGTSGQTAVSYVDMLNFGETMGHLEIPKIRIDLPIYRGTSDTVLEKGIGHIEQSSLPIGGVDTNTILTGHRGLPSSKLFTDLDKMEVGDLFYIHTLGDTLAYRVIEINIVLPTDIEKLKVRKGKDLSTLVTCTPYMVNSHRLLVVGERIPYQEKEEEKETEVTVKTGMHRLGAWVAENRKYVGYSVIIMGALGIILVYRIRKGRLKGDGQ